MNKNDVVDPKSFRCLARRWESEPEGFATVHFSGVFQTVRWQRRQDNLVRGQHTDADQSALHKMQAIVTKVTEFL